MMAVVEVTAEVDERPGWRAVGLPSEHGGWGLTLEPVLLGLLAAWSVAGAALGVAAFLAFLVRTAAKLVAVDVRRRRWLGRSQLALRIATVEAAVLLAAIAVATVVSGLGWLVPVLVSLSVSPSMLTSSPCPPQLEKVRPDRSSEVALPMTTRSVSVLSATSQPWICAVSEMPVAENCAASKRI